MRKVVKAALGIWLGLAGQSYAQGAPVAVVELFTSQGCSSCPPADDYLATIADRDDVIALSLHVDYWDYLGWKDKFATPAFTDRQHLYARATGQRTVYTPQVIVSGQDQVVGSDPGKISGLIRAHNAKAASVLLTLMRSGGSVKIAAQALTRLPTGMVVSLVRYIPTETVSIERGENTGRTIEYRNIVTSWDNVGSWDGVSDFATETGTKGDGPLVVIIQTDGLGPILAAARLK